MHCRRPVYHQFYMMCCKKREQQCGLARKRANSNNNKWLRKKVHKTARTCLLQKWIISNLSGRNCIIEYLNRYPFFGIQTKSLEKIAVSRCIVCDRKVDI